ncbi:Na+/H+ antiporter subunit D [Streptomyces sp. B93]|nr:Na+/H+ antiporter subunit D [Streptomyces sp. B93]MBQ1088649.1 Na+/H+ antiporter subunit D [Streptomyces sp. B93]
MRATMLALPVLLPLCGAGLSLLGPHRAAVRALSGVVLTVVLADALALLVLADRDGPQAVHMGGWPAPLGITLVADRLSALLLSVSALVSLAVLGFAVGQGTAEHRRRTARVFHPAYLVLVAGVGLAYLSGDLFNLFVAFETMLAASYVLITLDADRDRTRAGMTYTIVSLTSSLLFITLIALVYAATGTVTLAQLGPRLAELDDGLSGALALLTLTVLGIKTALVPLHFWLPDSYPTAPAPITAVFAALLTKVGVYAVLRTETLLFPRDGPWPLLAWVAIATLLTGILGALAQDDLNRLLSFTLVSHIGFMLFGLALFDVRGLTGTILYVVHHIVAQAALFLVADLMVRRSDTASLSRMAGRPAPGALVAVLFALPAMSLAGIPPFSGFVAKLALLEAGADDGGAVSYALLGAAVLTSALTLYAMTRVWTAGFMKPPRPERGPSVRTRGAWLMLVSAAGVTAAGLVITVGAGPLARLAERAAHDLISPQAYRSVVLGEGER